MTSTKEFLTSLSDWCMRVKSAHAGAVYSTRDWFVSFLGLEKLDTQELLKLLDSSDLNSEYVSKRDVTDPNDRKGISGIKCEIDALQGFTRGVVQRNRSRLQFYKADLGQKAHRNMNTAGQAHGAWDSFNKALSK